MIVRLTLLAVIAFGAIAALAHAQQPATVSVAVLDNRYAPESPTIRLGGSVKFAYDAGEELHNVHFEKAGPQCIQIAGASGGPVGRILPAVSEGPGWSGECTFSQPGVYRFLCDDHLTMLGQVTVANADGTLPTDGGATPTPTPTPTATPLPGGGTTTPPTSGGGTTTPTAPKLTLAASQRGQAVAGSFVGGSASNSAVIEALAKRTDLKAKGKAKLVRVGKVTKTVAAGAKVSFSVPLNAKGKAALKRLGRLKLTLKITIAGKTETKAVTLRKPAKAKIAQSSASVTVADNTFSPKTATIRRGGTVTWRWKGKKAHNVVGKGFASKLIKTGTFKRTFSKTGTFSYLCSLHRGMEGKVRVK
jgi:plastocyanin